MILKWFPVSSLQLKVAVGSLMGTATENKDCGKFGALLAFRSVRHGRRRGNTSVTTGTL